MCTPHGGLWEAAVESIKSHLKGVTGNLSFTFEEMYIILTRIEAILNFRSISPLSENPNELLTTGHFLRGASLVAFPDSLNNLSVENLSFMKRWNRLQAIQKLFARRWKIEDLTELQRRGKWRTEI